VTYIGGSVKETTMQGLTSNPWLRRVALALALAMPLMVLAASPARASASHDDLVWLRLEAQGLDHDDARVMIKVPLSLIEVVIDSVDKKGFLNEIEREHPSLDIAKMWRKIRKLDLEEFMTIETEKESVRVWKDLDFFRVNITEMDHDEAKVKLQIPLELMDYVFEANDSGRFDFHEMLDQIRHHLPLTLVQVDERDKSVRVWLEE